MSRVVVEPQTKPPAREVPSTVSRSGHGTRQVGARARTWLLPLALAAALAVALVITARATGATAPSVIGDPGAAVRWGLPLATGWARLAAAVAVGALALCAFVQPSGPSASPAGRGGRAQPVREGGSWSDRGHAWSRCRDLATVAAAAWALLQGMELALTYANVVGGMAPVGALGQFQEFLALDLGALLATATVAAAGVAIASVFCRGPVAALWVLLLALLSLAPLASTGHAAGAFGHGTAVLAMWLHVGAAALWVGGLAALVLTVRGEELPPAARRYSEIAGWCFAVLAFSGVVSALPRVPHPVALVTTGWGLVLLTKVGAFVVLGTLGYLHRRRTLPLLGDGPLHTPSPLAFLRLASGELALMAATVGLSVALASTQAPTAEVTVAADDPVVQLTGYPAPPEPGVLAYLTQWRLEPVTLLLGLSALAVYLRWVRRLHARGDRWPWYRTVCALVGLLGFLWVTNGALAVYGSVQFSAHMAQHLALVTVLPIPLALAAPVSLALRALPRRTDGSRGPREWLLALLHSDVATFLARPVVASVHVVAAMALLYLTPMHTFVLTNHWAHLLMVLHLSVAGYLFINALVGRDPGPRRPPHPVRLVLLLPSVLFHTFFGLGVLSSSTLLAAPYYARLSLPWLDDPLLDQQVGGALTWAMGELPILGVALLIALRWAAVDRREQARRPVVLP